MGGYHPGGSPRKGPEKDEKVREKGKGPERVVPREKDGKVQAIRDMGTKVRVQATREVGTQARWSQEEVRLLKTQGPKGMVKRVQGIQVRIRDKERRETPRLERRATSFSQETAATETHAEGFIRRCRIVATDVDHQIIG